MLVTNIQRFCLHDGQGIRTTVFFKGCNLKCMWCANPENMSFYKERYMYDGVEGTYGYEITLDELEKEILKDKVYYTTGGGVTFSGGESLFYFKKIEPLLKRLKAKNINMCVETALMVPKEYVEVAVKYIDEFIIDIKIMDIEKCKKLINGDVELYKKNVEFILKNNKNVTFRIPLIKPYTYNIENLKMIYEFLKINIPNKVEIFKVHGLAEKKYKTLNKKFLKINEEVTDYELEEVRNTIIKLGIQTEICKI